MEIKSKSTKKVYRSGILEKFQVPKTITIRIARKRKFIRKDELPKKDSKFDKKS